MSALVLEGGQGMGLTCVYSFNLWTCTSSSHPAFSLVMNIFRQTCATELGKKEFAELIYLLLFHVLPTLHLFCMKWEI